MDSGLFQRYLFSGAVLSLSLFAEDSAEKDAPSSSPPKDGYTINYNTVSIVEYIRFASKICNANFIFNEEELPFTVTVVSDAPITPQNVMATLVQTLRIHGLSLLEQGNNLVIHKSPSVRQPAALVFDNETNPTGAPIVTRVFRLKNANVDSLAAIIRPMISEGAPIEVSRETRQLILTDITAIVDKISVLIENLDSPHSTLEIRTFEGKYNKPEYLIELATQIMTPIAQGNPFILVPQSLANSVFLVSTPELNEKAIAVLTSLDTPPKKTILADRKIRSDNVFVIKLAHRTGDDAIQALKEISTKLQESGITEGDLVETIETVKWIRDTNSLMFVGSQEANVKIKEFVAALDIPGAAGGTRASFFIYKPQNRNADELQKSIKELASNLAKTKDADEETLGTLRGAKLNAMTNTLLFSGDPATFQKVRELLATIDSPSGKGITPFAKQNFYIYKIQASAPDQVENALKIFAKNLESSGIPEEGLVNTIANVKYVAETRSLVFVGPEDALQRLREVVPQFDTGIAQQSPVLPPSSQFLILKPKNVRGEQLAQSLKDVIANLKSSELADPALLRSFESMKWEKNTNSILFTGDPASLKRIEDLAATIDIPHQTAKPGYFIYKLQNPSGEAVEEDLDNLLKNMKSTGLKDTALANVIENMRYVKETNSLLLTGEPSAIAETKELIAKYDYPRSSRGPSISNFFMYKPQHATAAVIEKSLRDVGANLKRAELADPSLLAAIESIKYVETTNSLIFTGTPDAIQKIQGLLKEIDVPLQDHSPIQHIGKMTFLLVKLKNAGGPQVISSLKAIATDLKKSGVADKDFLLAIQNVKFVKETNSLMFTGTEEALSKVQALVEKFDVTALAAPQLTKIEAEFPGGPSEFFIYKPQSMAAPELEKTMIEFAENLKMSGLNDPSLFNAIQSMKYVEKTQSLVFTGNQKALERIKELLKQFDIPSGFSPEISAAGGPSIQAIDNTSFLVYKLEFHKGDEIQNALRQIAKDLIKSNAPVNQNLLNAINSIQWLEMTNSLLCSGDQETLTRLRELIKNLDIPLKQVFIEVLVIETSLTNALNFGLEWGGKVKYKDKFSGSYSNLTPTDTVPAGSFSSNLQQISATRTPIPTDIPFASNFELGVIGDIIKHKGQSFVSLGSLLNALQTDGETSVIMTPKIIAQDSRKATIFSGFNVPFAGSFISNSSANTVTTSNLEYRDIGMNLSITPVLGNSDIITLDISLDNSAQSATSTGATFNFTAGSASGITTSRTTMDTTVHVPNKHFLILSGMVNNTNTKSKAGIPCLGGLPVIGAAFSQNNDTNSNLNVVIFLRPTIINSISDMQELTAGQEEYFRNQTRSSSLERRYDEGMELIKSPEDE